MDERYRVNERSAPGKIGFAIWLLEKGKPGMIPGFGSEQCELVDDLEEVVRRRLRANCFLEHISQPVRIQQLNWSLKDVDVDRFVPRHRLWVAYMLDHRWRREPVRVFVGEAV
ncbi:hypothetical protein M3A49_39770 [Paraburkholderia sp. CNPSo 3076]|uniref:hypothetical protein n=1 Tax=Paraburkholderia sp. CNPSo 3076 TaxID=2940936 RepID=UPI00224FBA35|nr:hypothetical protein [Paraburkholderia sp. CNPSo 3076]MCX5545499.1 hypothetical protein [Paraburkholderia sp. CNPSo 3076]